MEHIDNWSTSKINVFLALECNLKHLTQTLSLSLTLTLTLTLLKI